MQHDHSERQQNFDVIDKGGRHVWTDQLANTLRVNRDGTQFEIICDRQRNNYETSLNSFGNIFTSDNDDDGNRGCRVIWAMDGGHYGYHTPGSPRHWGEEVPGNVPKLVGTGNGSPCGIMVYEGDLLPEEYRGAVFEVDAGTRQINLFPLTRKGAAFRAEYKVFLSGDDPWFRPVDACTAPMDRCSWLTGMTREWEGMHSATRLRAHLPCCANGAQKPEIESRHGDGRTDRRAQVAECRDSRCRSAGFDRSSAI